MDQLQRLLIGLRDALGAFRKENRQLFNLIAAAVGLSAVLGAGFYLFNPGAPVVLAANLAPADRTALALRLRHHDITFTLGEDSITVPSRELAEAQRILDQSPGFAGGGDDFSIFDRSTMGQSDFDEQVNYQRSLQGELERTIMEIHGIDSARVMLALGRPTPFALQAAEAEHASVMLTTAPGAVIDATMASAIAHLIASSVRGLTADSVTVSGNDGAILYPPVHGGELDEAMQLRNDFEHRLQEKVSSLLGRIMGDGRYAVAVSVDVDTSRVTSKEEIYGKGDQGAIVSEEHSVTPSGYQQAGGGVPGLTSNLPPPPRPTPLAAPSAEASSTDKSATDKTTADANATDKIASDKLLPPPPNYTGPASSDSDAARKDIVNYKPSSRETESVTAPVRIKRISVAAVLDGTYESGHFEPLPKDRLESIKGLVAAAVGVDAERGDSVDIQTAALSQPYVPPLPNPMQQLRTLAGNPTYLYGGLAAGVILLLGLCWMIKRTLGRLLGRGSVKVAEVQKPVSLPAAPVQAEAAAPPAVAETGAPASAPSTNGNVTYEEIRARINQEVERDPEAAAAVIRKWLNGTNGTNGKQPGAAANA
ncbi:MAG TPA: flagellar basal-body MS-ring/collar protein FliF [Candidatus Binataceae bacterium]|nr:flagellar basal-body MS-ring/collar protein FliF [Candidatus Binataceae bacterium]